ncbi:hypothetical protein SAMN05444920_1204 [Nonomuraea solani]|uniref:Uncharacterized protein n=1 Tax=Nonomuraea solani TaxID=1144553 RepID=A0A1H6ETV8_9ACTN|nr:hypothetical protein [Nonomuraea solani]SEH01300.1 hypothetical protein SAMN05444920_1204 [Nonomuraea solani]
MTSNEPLISSLAPFGTFGSHMYDFDLITLDGQLLVVGTPDEDCRACTWDPGADRWMTYELDAPDEESFTELTSLCAAVVDGRIVIGGGGDHQGFAMWDLTTGRVRLSAQDYGTASAVRADFGGYSRFVVGASSFTGVDLWDPSLTEPDDDDGDEDKPEQPSPYDSLVSVRLWCKSRTSSAAAAGLLDGRPVVVGGHPSGVVAVWDVEGRPLAEFDSLDRLAGSEDSGRFPGATLTDFALVVVDGRTQVVAAGQQRLLVGDPRSGEWGEELTVPGGEIVCLDADTVHGVPVAVTGAEDGTICVWDLTERRVLGRPFQKYDSEVFGVRLAELHGRPVVVSSGRFSSVDVWEIPS